LAAAGHPQEGKTGQSKRKGISRLGKRKNEPLKTPKHVQMKKRRRLEMRSQYSYEWESQKLKRGDRGKRVTQKKKGARATKAKRKDLI